MREVTVAVVQMYPRLNEVEENLAHMSDFIEKICAEQNVDLIVFPELITTGYECGVRFTDLAERDLTVMELPEPALVLDELAPRIEADFRRENTWLRPGKFAGSGIFL